MAPRDDGCGAIKRAAFYGNTVRSSASGAAPGGGGRREATRRHEKRQQIEKLWYEWRGVGGPAVRSGPSRTGRSSSAYVCVDKEQKQNGKKTEEMKRKLGR